MTEKRDADEARQAEYGKRTFVVLIISTAVAAVIAIGAYLYVFGEENEDLTAPIPEAGDEGDLTPQTE